MPRPDSNAPGPEQQGLFDGTALSPEEYAPVLQSARGRLDLVLTGRHSQATARAIAAAQAAELISDVDEAATTLLRAGAWALDAFEAQNKPYGPSKLMQGMNETLRELHMTPEARQDDTDDAMGELLAQMAGMDADDDANAGDAAPVHHPEA